MFQNINEGTIDSTNYKNYKGRDERKKIDLFADVLSLKNIPIYIISFIFKFY